ncbi:MAG: ATP-binding cassette domain-containing protein [Planctomycetaceae bacterium]|nr:ATP-binding cassette domain-containing protein [Planctomycetaceae bacterium]
MSSAAPPVLECSGLRKSFGGRLAVDGVGFCIGEGEVYGLLGPNGAGKTTTMRMLTTFLPPTSGRAVLSGHDVLDESLEVRRKVGYLPENVPLYHEMRVREYLTFRAKLKDVPRSRRRAEIARVIARCQLGEVEDRILGQLSKGYRQRVGLAEAMVRDPDILILDEPTAGLDPLQIREVRALIRELGDRHTILLSTHVMTEVEAVCGRVIIIAKGRIALDDRLDRLQAENAIAVEARGPAEAIRAVLEKVPGTEKVILTGRDGDHAAFKVQARGGADLREELATRLFQNGWPVRRLDLKRTTLEDRFIQAVAQEELAADAEAA